MNGLPSIAQHLAAQGRNGDSVLVHMTPGEVRGLQAIAEQHGTSLTINPDTGLPEAFSLRSLLPMIAGIALTPVLGPMGAALAVGGGTTVATGDIKQGLMAGLGAYGGASLGAGLGAAGTANAPVFTGPMVPDPTIASALNSTTTIGSVTPGLTPGMTYDMAGNLMPVGGIDPNMAGFSPSAFSSTPRLMPGGDPIFNSIQNAYVPQQQALAMRPGAFTSGTQAAQIAQTAPYAGDTSNLMAGEVPGMGRELIPRSVNPSYADMLRGTRDVFSSGPTGDAARSAFMKASGGPQGLALRGGAMLLGSMEQPKLELPEKEDPYANYEGPYEPSPRGVRYPTADELRRRRTSEFTYFSPSNPVPFQEGGDVNVTPAEADVYRNIANVQRMAGIPSIANMPMMVAPQGDMRGLVYNPVGYDASEMPRMEQDYGFKPRSSQNLLGGAGTVVYRKSGSEYTPFLVTGELDPKKYEYDPAVGGYVVKPSSGDMFEAMFRAGKGGGYATGGRVSVPMLEDGGFVLTKKAVDGLGKGDNKKGQKVASRGLGAVPIKGPGHGTSDSIRTTIEGKQPALVSNGEAYVPRKQVERNGGAKKFYALMKAAERRA